MYSETLQTQVAMTTSQRGESKCCAACRDSEAPAWFSLGTLRFSRPCSVGPGAVFKTNLHSVINRHLLLCGLVFAVAGFPPEWSNEGINSGVSWAGFSHEWSTMGQILSAISRGLLWSQKRSMQCSSMKIHLSVKVCTQTYTKLVRKGLFQVFLGLGKVSSLRAAWFRAIVDVGLYFIPLLTVFTSMDLFSMTERWQ